MEYGRAYTSRLMAASDAVDLIKSGDWVDYACFLSTPITLDQELAKRAGEVEDVKIRALGFPGLAAVAKADPEGRSFKYNSWHFTGADRKTNSHGQNGSFGTEPSFPPGSTVSRHSGKDSYHHR